MTANIFQFSWSNLLAWTSAYAVWEPISYALIPAMSSSKTVAEYYDPRKMPVAVVFFGDYIYSTLIWILATQVIGLAGVSGWWKAAGLFVVVQWACDLLFGASIQQVPPKWTGRYVDFFQRYVKEVGFKAAAGDSAYGLVWLSVMQGMRDYVPVWLQTALIVALMFGSLVFSY